ncbi:TPR repeat-containing protein [Dioscorea alata]|uniref:TPR repeat-containing protein n=1 Tax=Dioscorea alata TaxID=55571 RepID=A0ACB7WDD8_DIOAL|nr:TPR repeat-containing protein [Dioscorea alata]
MSHSLSNRFHSDLCIDGTNDKPDSKDFADLGSPVSPLRNLRAAPAATQTSSSSSSSGSVSGKPPPNVAARRSDCVIPGRLSHSGELSASGECCPTGLNSRPGHRRSGSGQLFYSSGGMGSSTASSPVSNVLPAGNICPSGRIGKSGMMNRSSARSDVLGSGTGNYGHGSIIRGGSSPAKASMDAEELTKAGNEHYKRGQFSEALKLYDRAVAMCSDNASCRSNRAAALAALGRLCEAVKECEDAVRLDQGNAKAHQRLASLHLRLGQVENAKKHLFLSSRQPDPVEVHKMEQVERHLERCAESRKIGDWKSALRESDAAIAAGADSSPLINATRAEALLRLHRLEESDLAISSASKLANSSPSSLANKFFGMISDSYIYIVQAQVEMALGRFESAVKMAEKAKQVDPRNVEVTVMLNNVKSVVRARTQGNEFFNSGKFAEACIAYGEGLRYDPSNSVLYCNRAACRSKLGQWEKSIEDCNEALKIQVNYTKALLRRAASYAKLERWADSVRDYEVLSKELPGDKEVAEALFHARISLKASRGEEISNLKFGGEVEKITSVEQFQAAISLPGVSVVHFVSASNLQCNKITPFVDDLCTRYPSVNFLKVDINESVAVAKAENVRIVPTVKIYKNRVRVKEMICPSQQVLECSVRHYVL